MSRPAAYDALLLVSFGGPEGPDEVIPFLENVLRGRNVPRERMLAVAEHYQQFGGVSPINAQNRALIDAFREKLQADGIDLPIYFGNRNWHPLLADTVRQMRDAGVRRALALVTSVFSSYSGCRQYLEDIARARQAVGDGAPEIDKIRVFFNHPGYVETMIERTRAALAGFPPERRAGVRLVFTAHSIPLVMAQNCRYEAQFRDTSRLVSEALDHPAWDIAYQSRSGPPTQPWLEPDVLDHLAALHAAGVQDVLLVPIGFISDHMEVIYDLDTEAVAKAHELGLNLRRAATAGTHPRFVRMCRELVEERLRPDTPRPSVGNLPVCPDVCPADCCASGRPSMPAR